MSDYDDAIAKAVYANILAGAAVGPRSWLPTSTAFDGVDDIVNSGVTLNSLGSAWAAAAWVKVAADQSQGTTDNWLFGVSGESAVWSWGNSLAARTGVVYGRNSDGVWSIPGSPNTIPPGTWRHYGMVFDGSELKGYVEGVQVSSASISSFFLGWDTIRFGSVDGRFTKGDYSQALILAGGTGDDIAALYAGPPTTSLRRKAFRPEFIQFNTSILAR